MTIISLFTKTLSFYSIEGNESPTTYGRNNNNDQSNNKDDNNNQDDNNDRRRPDNKDFYS